MPVIAQLPAYGGMLGNAGFAVLVLHNPSVIVECRVWWECPRVRAGMVDDGAVAWPHFCRLEELVFGEWALDIERNVAGHFSFGRNLECARHREDVIRRRALRMTPAGSERR